MRQQSWMITSHGHADYMPSKWAGWQHLISQHWSGSRGKTLETITSNSSLLYHVHVGTAQCQSWSIRWHENDTKFVFILNSLWVYVKCSHSKLGASGEINGMWNTGLYCIYSLKTSFEQFAFILMAFNKTPWLFLQWLWLTWDCDPISEENRQTFQAE